MDRLKGGEEERQCVSVKEKRRRVKAHQVSICVCVCEKGGWGEGVLEEKKGEGVGDHHGQYRFVHS